MSNKKWIFFILIFILTLFEVTTLDSFKIFNVKPNLILIGVVIISLFLDLKWVMSLSLFAGISKDIFSLNSFGTHTLLFPLYSLAIIELSKKIPLDNNILRCGLLFILMVINDVVIRIIFIFLGRSVAPLGIFLRITFLETIYTTALLPLVIKVTKPEVYLSRGSFVR